MAETTVIDVSTASFAVDVIAQSHQLPVVVDFWAPWCGPCRELGPVLERVNRDHAGSWVLAKVNTDDHPELGRDHRIQGIPAVKAFRNGEVVAEFVGALREPEVRRFVAGLLPSAADQLGKNAFTALANGELLIAEADATAAIELDPTQDDALWTLGVIDEQRLRFDDAMEWYRRITSGRHVPEASRRIAALELRSESKSLGDENELLRRAEREPHNPALRYQAGLALAARGESGPALEHLLEVVRLDRSYGDDAARKAMLKVFEQIGVRSEMADDYRKRLARLLY